MGQNPSWGITLGISLHQWNGGTPFPPGSGIFPQNRGSRRPRATPGRVRSPAGPGPGRRHPPFLPGRSRGPLATATAGRAHSHPSASSCRSSCSSERSAPRGEKKGPVSASGTRRAAPAVRPPGPGRLPAPRSRAGFSPATIRDGGRQAGAGRRRCRRRRATQRTGGHVPAILWSPPPPRCPGYPGLNGAARAGSRWTCAGGAARRRAGPAGARARGGPRARDWGAGGAAPGRRGRAGPGPRPALPGRSVRLRGGG